MAAPKKKCLIALIRGCWFWFDKTSTQNFACWNQFVFVKPCWEKSRGLLKFSVCHFLSYLVFWQVVLRNGLKWVNIARCATNPWCDRRFCSDGMFWFSFTILSTKVWEKWTPKLSDRPLVSFPGIWNNPWNQSATNLCGRNVQFIAT